MSKGAKALRAGAAVLAGFIVGGAVWFLGEWFKNPDLRTAGMGMSVGLPSLIALFGVYWATEQWKDAISSAFVVGYLCFVAGVMSMSILSGKPLGEFGDKAQAILNTYSGMVTTVVVAWLGVEAVQKIGDAYVAGKSAPGPSDSGVKTPPTGTGSQ